ncbi:MAG: extracellular solute-binding protein family 1 [Paenibacillaceae bacterium]|jgi:putative aldouronate transport system substrate-binding protein|nr:extracellular solute-binding protein family 1 [Paenibacillaceae bacterium]
MKRKLGFWLITAALASGSIAGCASDKEDAAGTEAAAAPQGSASSAQSAAPAAPPAKITVIKPLYAGHVYFADSELEKLVEKGANVEVTYETPPSAEYKNVLNVKLAGGDIPDIINTFSPNDAEHNALIDQGVFLALDDLLPKFPKLKASFSDEIWNMMRNPTDGKIYGVPWLRDRGGTGIFIRKDWLEKLNLQEPKTLDEFTAILKAFRDNDPDGNGQKDTIPLAFKDNNISYTQSFATLFGTNPGWSPDAADSSKLTNGQLQPGMKEALTYLRGLREDGLLDPDYLIGKTTGFDKFKSGKVGVVIAGLGDFRQVAVLKEMKAEILDPIKHGNNIWQLLMPSLPISRVNQIAKKSKNPEAALRFLEYQITDGYDYIQYGVEGKTYSVVNGVKTPFEADKKDNQYNTNVGLELLQPEWLFSDTEKYTKFVSKETAEYIIAKMDLYERNIAFDYIRSNIVFPYRNETSAQLGQVITEGFSKILLDNKTDPAKLFDETVAKWKKDGGDKVTEEINKLQTDKSQPQYKFMKK